MGPRANGWLLLSVAAVVGITAILMLRGGDEAGPVVAPSADVDKASKPSTDRELPPPPPAPPVVAVLRGRVGAGGPVLTMADPGPLGNAVEFLLKCQGEDGLFHAVEGAVDDDPRPEAGHDLAVTAWVALALLDAVEPEGGTPAAKAATRALGALAKAVASETAAKEPVDLEGLVLASWALASGYGRTANEAWKAPLAPAVARVLERKDASGGWRAGADRIEDDLLLTVEVMGLASEVRPMRATRASTTAIDEAIGAAGEWALSVRESNRAPSRGPGVVALEFLLRGVEESYALAAVPGPDLVSGPPPARALDHASVLWGSVLRFPRGGQAAIDWNREVLEPAATRQRGAGPGAGSWDPLDARSRRYGRVYATALEAMAWLFPRVPYREPRET